MSTASNGLERNDLNGHFSLPITFQLYGPHSCIGIMLIVMDEPIDQYTGMSLVVVIKWEEKENPPNFHCFHAWLRLIQDNKHGITFWVTMKRGSWSYSLIVHPSSSTLITGCKEGGNSRMIDFDIAFKLRVFINCGRQHLVWVVEQVTSSYVYIRLVLVTSLAEKIQRTIFYISIFPTVSKMYSKQRLLDSFFLLTNICFTS